MSMVGPEFKSHLSQELQPTDAELQAYCLKRLSVYHPSWSPQHLQKEIDLELQEGLKRDLLTAEFRIFTRIKAENPDLDIDVWWWDLNPKPYQMNSSK